VIRRPDGLWLLLPYPPLRCATEGQSTLHIDERVSSPSEYGKKLAVQGAQNQLVETCHASRLNK
jgi:hypothetical protein